MLLRDKLYINGQWVAPTTKETIDVHNAGTGEVMGTVPALWTSIVSLVVGATHWPLM